MLLDKSAILGKSSPDSLTCLLASNINAGHIMNIIIDSHHSLVRLVLFNKFFFPAAYYADYKRRIRLKYTRSKITIALFGHQVYFADAMSLIRQQDRHCEILIGIESIQY